jgi:hypothetical protein
LPQSQVQSTSKKGETEAKASSNFSAEKYVLRQKAKVFQWEIRCIRNYVSQ